MWELWITIGGIAFIFLMTALGSAVVFFFKGEISQRLRSGIFGFTAGIMVSASILSLLIPAIETVGDLWGAVAVFPVVISLLIGAFFVVFLDKRIPGASEFKKAGDFTRKKAWRMFVAVSLHNIPEGLAVGFAFGSCARGDIGAFLTASALALGIGIQNFPEGLAVALPLKSVFNSNKKAFLWGSFSGLFEPISAVLGYFLACKLQIVQPFLLAFSAGAMLFVSAQDLLPDSSDSQTASIGAWGFMLGFAVMTVLDVALG
jgi:ZIP family zinc transporter